MNIYFYFYVVKARDETQVHSVQENYCSKDQPDSAHEASCSSEECEFRGFKCYASKHGI